MTSERPRLLVISAVRPYPGGAGQEQRVRNKLLAFREHFETAFLIPLPLSEHDEARQRLAGLVDEAILLPSRYLAHPARRLAYRLAATAHALATGLKTSNYLVGHVELGPGPLLAALDQHKKPDLVVVEYWHPAASIPHLQALGLPCVLDMHDFLWRSYERQLAVKTLPESWRRWQVRRYRRREEAAWKLFDALITINREEHEAVRKQLPGKDLFYAPMGTDMDFWSYGPEPASPPRIAYFGALANAHNQRSARRCAEEIMPQIWRHQPDVELWLVGSRPPEDLRAIAEREPRVRVTGFVEDAPALLRTMRLVLCPWEGTYGFRSRLVEVMALGVPVVASPDAVDGMDLRENAGLFLADGEEMAARALAILAGDPAEHGRAARQQVEDVYSFAATYGRLSGELREWIQQ